MPVTANKGYSVPTPGTESGTWGTDLNANTFSVIDLNLGGTVYITVSNTNVIMTAAQAQNGIIRIGGVITANLIVSIPTAGIYAVHNETVGGYYVYINGPVGPMHMLPQNTSTIVHVDGGIGAYFAGQRLSTAGMIACFSGSPPNGWLLSDGSLLSRVLFPDLWTYAQASGNLHTEADWITGWYGAFSSGDGSTTFRIPDLRGNFIRAWAQAAVVHDAGRALGNQQTDGIANHTHSANSVVTDPSHVHPTSKPGLTGYNTVGGSTVMSNSALGNTTAALTGVTVATSISNNIGGLAETRPYNISLAFCISTT